MLKKVLVFLILLSVACMAHPQQKGRDRVKRKYQQADEGNKKMPQVKVYGRVQDIHRGRIPGARVSINGTRLEVHTNDLGEYFLKGMSTGRVRIVVSCAGYQSKYIDYVLQEGNNTVYFTLDKSTPSLDPMVSGAQLREQQLPDVPGSVVVWGDDRPDGFREDDLPGLVRRYPGAMVSGWSPFTPGLALRGASGPPLGSPSPGVSVFMEEVPMEGLNPFSTLLYDVDRIEVLKGPQSTLFGGGGVSGGLIRVIPKKPADKAGGYLLLGGGDYRLKEVRSAVGFPLVKNRLNVRMAGSYSSKEGYIPGGSGIFLNGKNSLGGRLTIGMSPVWNLRMNLMATWQKEDIPGLALVNPDFPNERGELNYFGSGVTLDTGRNPANRREVAGLVLEGKWLRNPNNYLVFRSSGFQSELNSVFDADGTRAPALFFTGRELNRQLTQEIRYNFSRKSRINGAAGVFGRWFTARKESVVLPEEQYLSYLMLDLPRKLVSSGGEILPLLSVPADASFGSLAGLSLPPGSEETNQQQTDVRQAEMFADATWRLTYRFSLTAGIRGAFQWLKAENETPDGGGNASLLGQLTGNLPQVVFKPDSLTEIRNKQADLSFRAVLKMDLAENATLHAGLSKGYRSPEVFFHSSGDGQVLGSEKVNSFFAGFKSAWGNRVWLDLTGYYQVNGNRRTAYWEGNHFKIREIRKVPSLGADAEVKAVLFKWFTLSGSYAFIHSRFSAEAPPQLSGKRLQLTPQHSYSLGAKVNLKLSPWSRFFALPAYAWKSRFWFDDAHSPRTEQPAYGILDATAGIDFPGAGITLSCTGSNLLGEQYLLYAGQPANLMPVTLVMPGPPRMISGRILWRF